jgi:hypothetical protein
MLEDSTEHEKPNDETNHHKDDSYNAETDNNIKQSV